MAPPSHVTGRTPSVPSPAAIQTGGWASRMQTLETRGADNVVSFNTVKKHYTHGWNICTKICACVQQVVILSWSASSRNLIVRCPFEVSRDEPQRHEWISCARAHDLKSSHGFRSLASYSISRATARVGRGSMAPFLSIYSHNRTLPIIHFLPYVEPGWWKPGARLVETYFDLLICPWSQELRWGRFRHIWILQGGPAKRDIIRFFTHTVCNCSSYPIKNDKMFLISRPLVSACFNLICASYARFQPYIEDLGAARRGYLPDP